MTVSIQPYGYKNHMIQFFLKLGLVKVIFDLNHLSELTVFMILEETHSNIANALKFLVHFTSRAQYSNFAKEPLHELYQNN